MGKRNVESLYVGAIIGDGGLQSQEDY